MTVIDLVDQRRQLGRVSAGRHRALPVALQAEVRRPQRCRGQLDLRPGHRADLDPVQGPAAQQALLVDNSKRRASRESGLDAGG